MDEKPEYDGWKLWHNGEMKIVELRSREEEEFLEETSEQLYEDFQKKFRTLEIVEVFENIGWDDGYEYDVVEVSGRTELHFDRCSHDFILRLMNIVGGEPKIRITDIELGDPDNRQIWVGLR